MPLTGDIFSLAEIKQHKIAEKIASSAHEIIKSDPDKSEPGHPLRILKLNHGIIGTRTHNTDIYEYCV